MVLMLYPVRIARTYPITRGVSLPEFLQGDPGVRLQESGNSGGSTCRNLFAGAPKFTGGQLPGIEVNQKWNGGSKGAGIAIMPSILSIINTLLYLRNGIRLIFSSFSNSKVFQ